MEQIELSIVKGLLYDQDYCRKVMPYLKPEYFEGITKTIFQKFSKFYNEYNKPPTVETLVVSIQKSGLDEHSYEEAIDTIEQAVKSRKVLNDTDWLVSETQDYCKNKSLYDSIYKAISIIEGKEKNVSEGIIPELLEKSLSISFNTTIGSDYIDDALRRYEWYTSEEAKIPFKLSAFNKLTNGGLPKKTLNVLLAGTNSGKSSTMCFNAAEWLRDGKNILYFSMEMSEEAITERIDMNLLDMDSNQLRSMTRDGFMDKITKLAKTNIGKLKVKEFPTGEPNANHFKSVMKELKQKQSFVPDVVIIDYINICSSVRYSTSGTNSYSYIKAIAEELRGLAVSEDVAILTATQTNREGSTSSDPGMDSISDSFGIAMTADWICFLAATEELVEMGQVLVGTIKTRYGSKSNLKPMVIGVDYNRMRYYDIGEQRNEVSETTDALTKLRKESKVTEKEINW